MKYPNSVNAGSLGAIFMKSLLLSSVFFISLGCTQTQNSYDIRNIAIDHISELEQIKEVILHNFTLLKDSCCQNLANSCGDPDSIKKRYFYPATYFLLDRYLPKKDKPVLAILHNLSPIDVDNSNKNIISSDLSFRYFDSTIIFPVFNYRRKDTIIEHLIIYSKSPNIYQKSEENGIYNQIEIKPNWKYYILWRIDYGS